MNSISRELLTYVIKNEVQNVLADIDDKIINKVHSLSTEILEDIKTVLSQHYKLSDFEMIEKIVVIFEKYNIDCGSCHDFG
ncbi:MAG: hypothetical protein E7406_04620 [Ruminococcaceae bacterium]|nr:hypothetical protein [Oscillospiraceae bacterium]